MRQKIGRRDINERTTRHLATACRADPAGLHEHVERTLGDLNPAYRLDLRATHGFMIGDDRQRLDCGTRELAWLLALAPQDMGKVGRRLEVPAPAPLDQFDTAPGIMIGKNRKVRHDALFNAGGALISTSVRGSSAAKSTASTSRIDASPLMSARQTGL